MSYPDDPEYTHTPLPLSETDEGIEETKGFDVASSSVKGPGEVDHEVFRPIGPPENLATGRVIPSVYQTGSVWQKGLWAPGPTHAAWDELSKFIKEHRTPEHLISYYYALGRTEYINRARTLFVHNSSTGAEGEDAWALTRQGTRYPAMRHVPDSMASMDRKEGKQGLILVGAILDAIPGISLHNIHRAFHTDTVFLPPESTTIILGINGDFAEGLPRVPQALDGYLLTRIGSLDVTEGQDDIEVEVTISRIVRGVLTVPQQLAIKSLVQVASGQVGSSFFKQRERAFREFPWNYMSADGYDVTAAVQMAGKIKTSLKPSSMAPRGTRLETLMDIVRTGRAMGETDEMQRKVTAVLGTFGPISIPHIGSHIENPTREPMWWEETTTEPLLADLGWLVMIACYSVRCTALASRRKGTAADVAKSLRQFSRQYSLFSCDFQSNFTGGVMDLVYEQTITITPNKGSAFEQGVILAENAVMRRTEVDDDVYRSIPEEKRSGFISRSQRRKEAARAEIADACEKTMETIAGLHLPDEMVEGVRKLRLSLLNSEGNLPAGVEEPMALVMKSIQETLKDNATRATARKAERDEKRAQRQAAMANYTALITQGATKDIAAASARGAFPDFKAPSDRRRGRPARGMKVTIVSPSGSSGASPAFGGLMAKHNALS